MKKVLLLVFLICLPLFAKTRITFPLRWDARAYLARLNPRDDKAFIDGMMYAGVDMAELNKPNITIKLAAVKWTMMGFVEEGIIFDPRYMHYSLQPSIRWELEGHYMEIVWEHDCFHELDQSTENTVIWNGYSLEVAQNENISSRRHEEILSRKENGFYFDPYYIWAFRMGFFPHDDESDWLQRFHDIEGKLQANLYFSPIGYGPVRFEMEYRPLWYTHRDGETSDKHYGQLATTYYSENSSLSFFWGYTFRETQPVRPNDKKTWWGFYWRI
ncbi:MAG: hypothetical protein ACLFSQ_13360 [Candidatus Zixiibacteriota bacterium]